MIRTLIISDLHLDPGDAARYDAVMTGVRRIQCDQLVLAGDIFEAWIGSDGACALDTEILSFFGTHTDDTVFLPGNRDFLVSSEWLAQFQIRLAPSLALPGTLVIHGDELCTDDHAYQTFKAEVRQTAWQQAFLAKPLAEREAIAQGLRQASRETQANRAESIGDAVESTIDLWMQDFEIDLLIHGHTHRPAIHVHTMGLRAVTSDWASAGIAFVLDHDSCDKRKLTMIEITPTAITTRAQWAYTDGMPEWKRNSVSGDWIN